MIDWWQARRRRKVVAAFVCLSFAFAAINVVLALGQWDPGRIEFSRQEPLELVLERGDRRIVYMSAAASGPLGFDFYASDFTCTADGPVGSRPLDPVDRLRLLNVWEDHRAIGSFTAPETGTYVLTCRGPDVGVVVARPETFRIGWTAPQFALLLALVVLVFASCVLVADAVAGRLRHRHRRDNGPDESDAGIARSERTTGGSAGMA